MVEIIFVPKTSLFGHLIYSARGSDFEPVNHFS